MLTYFVIFCFIGFVIGFVLKDVKISLTVIAIITFCWALKFGPWALATLVELIMGYALAKAIDKRKSEK